MSTYVVRQLRGLGLGEAVAYRLAQSLEIRSFEANEVLAPEGVRVSRWRMLINGMVAETQATGDSLRPIHIHGPKNWFGMIQILHDDPSPFAFACLTDVELISLPAATLSQAMTAEPQFAQTMLKYVASQNQLMAEFSALMRWGNACLRIVLGMAYLAKELVRNTDGTQSAAPFGSLLIPLRQAILAQYCGVSRSMFSDFAQVLQSENWLRLDYGHIELVDIATWMRVLDRYRLQGRLDSNVSIESVLKEFETVQLGPLSL